MQVQCCRTNRRRSKGDFRAERIEMNRRRYKSPIPKSAREVVDKAYSDGAKEASSYFVGRTMVGRRVWWDDGQTVFLEYGVKDGKKHGNEMQFHRNGLLLSVEPHRDGKAHGKATQFAANGSVLICYVLKNGVGMDLWCDDDGNLSEEHYYPAKGELGYNRWWNEENKSIWREESWLDGLGWHGILREWNGKGRLCRGFPQFYVNGQRLTKSQYLRACQTDQSFPPYDPEQNQPFRTLPSEYLAQRPKRRMKGGVQDH